MAKSEPVRKPPQQEPRTSKTANDAISKAIGRQLRAVYDEALNEPIPSELSELVNRLSRNADKQGKG